MTYFVCICAASLFAMAAQKRNSKFLLFLVALILSLLCGLRGDGVGVDTLNYMSYFANLRAIGIGFGSDIGFSVFAYGMLQIFEESHIVLLICAFITNFLIIFRLWDFRDRASLSMMVFIFSVMHYPYTFNIVRQYLAIAMVFYGTRYIEKKKPLVYILINIVAVSIHTSSLVCFSFMFMKHTPNETGKKRKYLWYLLAIVLVVIGLFIFQTNAQKYVHAQ